MSWLAELLWHCGSCRATVLIHKGVSDVLVKDSSRYFLGVEVIVVLELANVLHKLVHHKRIHFEKRHRCNTLLHHSLEVLQRILSNELLL